MRVAAERLAGAGVFGGQRAGRGAVRADDESRLLRLVPAVDAGVPRRSGAVGTFRWHGTAVWRPADADVRHGRSAGVDPPGAGRRVLGAGLVGNAVDRKSVV